MNPFYINKTDDFITWISIPNSFTVPTCNKTFMLPKP
jgi:hypothetical protein